MSTQNNSVTPSDQIAEWNRSIVILRNQSIASLSMSGLVFLAIVCLTVAYAIFLNRSKGREKINHSPISPYQHFVNQADAQANVPETDYTSPILRNQRIILVSMAINAISAKDIINKLNYLNCIDPKKPIALYLITPGGGKPSTLAILDTMHTIQAPVDVWALGRCESAGAMILAGATGRRYATPQSIIMFHVNDDDIQHRKAHSMYGILANIAEQFWRKQATLPKSWYPFSGNHRYFLTPKEALKYHIIDAIRSKPIP